MQLKKFKIIVPLTIILTIIGLYHYGLFDSLIKILDAEPFSFKIAETKYSVYKTIKAIFAIAVVFWAAKTIATLVEHNFKKLSHFDSSNRELIIKAVHITIAMLAILTVMDLIGIDLKALTIFGGALGIGLGFGLQKITSNFISGIILLFEKSVKEGDLLELTDGVNGFIRKISARYTLIETPEHKEYLVPNEDLITQRVVNWTYSNTLGRILILITVKYDADMDLVRQLLLDAAETHPRCSRIEAPNCFMNEFTPNGVRFRLHVWVDDVKDGRLAVQSEIMFKIIENFKANNIIMPYDVKQLYQMEAPLKQTSEKGNVESAS